MHQQTKSLFWRIIPSQNITCFRESPDLPVSLALAGLVIGWQQRLQTGLFCVDVGRETHLNPVDLDLLVVLDI